MRTGGTFAVGLHGRGDYQSIHYTGRRGRFFLVMYTDASSRAKIIVENFVIYFKLLLKPKCIEVLIFTVPDHKKKISEL